MGAGCPNPAPIPYTSLDVLRLNHTIPAGYGACDEEMEDGFETIEVIPLGRGGRKELEVPLPEEVWRPRMELWAQGLYVMSRILYTLETL